MSTLNDGFGDSLSANEIIEMHAGITHRIAWERQTSDAPYDDLVQEARITLWKLHSKREGKRDDLRGLASVAIRRRSQELAERQTWTGYESRRGRAIDPLRGKRESMDQIVEDLGVEVFGAADNLDGIEMAYHEGQIMQALCALSPAHRAYVVLRFWGGWTQPEIAEQLQATEKAVSNWWLRDIRPRLERELQHLSTGY